MKLENKSTKQLKKQLDSIYSEWIRRKYSVNGYTQCYTCYKILPWKEIQCGHFVSRKQLATRFDERNTRPQCVGCNIFGKGKTSIFAENLEKEISGIVVLLYREANKITKDFPYISKIKYYQDLLSKCA